ncbi:nuclear transport factor 2 family protein [Clostridium sp. SYSU_GA19001]|uniref:nuclear transport factor 2 family protein n=1 Tax=Clostridium caldaquaticum TaxID=2940653 RepID=UPI0020771B5A|nr:nuclear transport factor 2 family protein [Clostridium caldaquaticum]MCM8709961.1 nuclear transport factor 2 family protein [Clostridium caldaquaticum]
MEMSINEKVERLWDIHEIKNLMGKYAFYHNAHEHMYTVNLFALKTEGVRIENDSLGIFEGPEGIKKFFYDFHTYMDGDKLGSFNLHTLTTEVIEVARDGKTAKAVWMSPGMETRKDTGELRSAWCWGKYAVDFIKEDGVWKFWHFIITTEIYCDYYKSWVDYSLETSDRKLPASDKPSRFGTLAYSTKGIAKLIPIPPEPYETYDGDTFYKE